MEKIRNHFIKKIKYRKNLPIRFYIGFILFLAVLLYVIDVKSIGSTANGSHLQFSENTKDEVRISFVGDIMTSRYVQTEIDRNGLESMLEDAQDTWKESDLVLANIENAIIDGEPSSYIMADKNISLGTRLENILTLQTIGIDVFGFANNHTADFGLSGLRETIDAIHVNDIDAVGIGNSKRNLEEFYKKYEINGLEIAVVAHSEIVPTAFSALNNKPGIASHYNNVAFQIIDRIKDQVDVIIMMVHWGEEYALNVKQELRSLGQSYIDRGVDVIIGSHPHVIQPVEKYNDGVIIYSMGNFVFDQTLESTKATAMGSLVIDQDLNIKLEFIPFEIYHASPKRVSKGSSYRFVKRQLTRLLENQDYSTEQGILEINVRGNKYVQK